MLLQVAIASGSVQDLVHEAEPASTAHQLPLHPAPAASQQAASGRKRQLPVSGQPRKLETSLARGAIRLGRTPCPAGIWPSPTHVVIPEHLPEMPCGFRHLGTGAGMGIYTMLEVQSESFHR